MYHGKLVFAQAIEHLPDHTCVAVFNVTMAIITSNASVARTSIAVWPLRNSLSREPARYRSLPARPKQQTLSYGATQHDVPQHPGRRQRATRLAYLCACMQPRADIMNRSISIVVRMKTMVQENELLERINNATGHLRRQTDISVTCASPWSTYWPTLRREKPLRSYLRTIQLNLFTRTGRYPGLPSFCSPLISGGTCA